MVVTCWCGRTFEARSSKARYCSDRCRKRKPRDAAVSVLSGSPGDVGAVERAVVAELTAAGRLDAALGQACVVLARRLDRPGLDTGSAVASVAARLELALAAAMRGAGRASGPSALRDELEERRSRRRA